MTTAPMTRENLTPERLRLALRLAKEAAEKADPGEGLANDGGTCNFDSATIPADRLSEAAILEIGGKELSVSKWFGKRRIFFGFLKGQAARRTTMMEAQLKALRENGFEAHGYYQMD